MTLWTIRLLAAAVAGGLVAGCGTAGPSAPTPGNGADAVVRTAQVGAIAAHATLAQQALSAGPASARMMGGSTTGGHGGTGDGTMMGSYWTMGQAQAGHDGGWDISGPAGLGVHCDDSVEGEGGFQMHYGHDDTGEHVQSFDVLPRDDGSLLVMLHPGSVVVSRLADGSLEVRDAGMALMCQVAISQDGDSLVVTQPDGSTLTVVPNDDETLTITSGDGIVATVPLWSPETGA
jgi:hypothetical protein